MVRPLMALIAALCMLCQISGVLHLALVEHVRCADHGHLVHASAHHETESPKAESHQTGHDEGAVHESAHESPVAERSEGPESSGQAGWHNSSEDDHEHDHCTLMGMSEPSLAPAMAQPTMSAAWDRGELCQVFASADNLPVCGVVDFAPKTSPPV